MSQRFPTYVRAVPSLNLDHAGVPDSYRRMCSLVRYCGVRQLAAVMSAGASSAEKCAMAEPSVVGCAVQGGEGRLFRGGEFSQPDRLIGDRDTDTSSRDHAENYRQSTIRNCIDRDFLFPWQLELLDSQFQSIQINLASIGNCWPSGLVCSTECATNQGEQDAVSTADSRVLSQGFCNLNRESFRFDVVRLDLMEQRRPNREEIQHA